MRSTSKEKRRMMEWYDKLAPSYDELYGEEQVKKYGMALSLEEVLRKDLVLDVGCGTGLFLEFLGNRSPPAFYVGVDFSSGMLSFRKRSKEVAHDYVLADAEFLPFKDSCFDKVFSITVLQDSLSAERMEGEMMRVSRGAIVISVLKKGRFEMKAEGKLREAPIQGTKDRFLVTRIEDK